VAILAAVILIAFSTAAALVLNYQPLRGGPIQWPPPTGVGAVAVPEHWLGSDGFQALPMGAERLRVPAPQGLSFSYRYSFYNRGSVPVTVTSIGFPRADQAGESLTKTAVAVNVGGTGWRSWFPYTPLIVQARQSVSVEVNVRVTDCLKPGDIVEWDTDKVAFTVFGIHRTAILTTNVLVQLVGVPQTC